jgi:nicotinamidase-related amidase
MSLAAMEPDISYAALIIVDMQNDFLHPGGATNPLCKGGPWSASIRPRVSPLPG